MNYRQAWKFINDAYTGDNGFYDGGEIDKYTRETDDKIRNRREIAYYSNLFESKVNRYIGYLYKRPPLRNVSKNKLLEGFINNCNNKGDHLDVFMNQFTKFAKAKGVNILLIDNVAEIPGTFEEQLEKRAYPYIQQIKPENITNYKLDEFGNFEFVAFKDALDESTYQKKDTKNVIRYFDKTTWVIYDQSGEKILDNGEHDLGVCPVIYFSEKGEFESLGEFSKLAWLSKRHYNLHSEQDEQLRGNTFSILTINGSANSEIKLSTDNALFYEGQKAPSFIAPPSDPMAAYSEKIDKLEMLMDKIGYDITTSKSAESGISLDIKFQGLNSSLSAFARSVEIFEMKIFNIVKKYLGIETEVNIAYKKDFNLVDVHKELETLKMVDDIADIPTYRALKLKQIIKSDLQNVTDEEMAQIIAEIEDSQKEV